MSIFIEPIPDTLRLKITGDVHTTLVVPYDEDDRFLLGFSDGTLLVGSYDDALRCLFEVARYGAGIIRFVKGRAIIDWRIEWATISVYDANVVEPPLPEALPLFPDLDRWAA